MSRLIEENNQLNIINDWGGANSDRKLCWSGTPYGLFTGLDSLCKVRDIPLDYTFIDKLELSMYRYLNKLKKKNDFNIIKTYQGEKKINKMQIEQGIPNLVFLEYNSNNIEDTYIYQDLTVDFIARLRNENPDISKFSPLTTNVSEQEVMRRIEITRSFNKACKGIFTMSKWLADDLINITGIDKKKVHYIGGGCNIDITKINPVNKNGMRFLFVGKDWDRKNGPLVVKAFQRLRQYYSNVELYIAGPIVSPLKSTDNNEGIIFLGRKTYEELVEYYNLCDYFVMPSKFEAYGIVFAEALIFGLPCIGRNAFAMPEFITDGENGYLVEGNCVDELYQIMKKTLDNKEDLKNNVLSQHSLYVNRYSWNTVASKILDVMRKDGYKL